MSTPAYSRVHRTVEIAAIAGYLAILGFSIHRTISGGWLDGPATVAWAALAVFTGLVCADFVSGFVHWLADSFGSVDLPIIGPAFVRPFREHHDDPTDITRHDFIEVNGNNCVVILMFLPFVVAVQAGVSSAAAAWVETWAIAFTIAIFMTNQIHSWAHADEVPAGVALLQRSRLILSVEDHDVHHRAPHDTYFCITLGWLNPILHRLDFFARLYRVVVTLAPFTANTDADVHAAFMRPEPGGDLSPPL